MKIVKNVFFSLLFILFCLMLFPLTSFAMGVPVNTLEQLPTVTNSFDPTNIIVGNNIVLALGDIALDEASLFVAMCSFIMTVLTVFFAIIAFIGYREIRDIREVHDELKSSREKYVKTTADMDDLCRSTDNRITDIVGRFEKEAQLVMQANSYFAIGSDSFRNGDYHVAIMYLKKSLDYFPENTDALCFIGRAYTNVGETNASVKYFEDALKIDTACAAAYRGLAAWCRYTNPSVAIEHAEKAVAIEPENIEIVNYLGLLLRDQNRIPEALNVHIQASGIREHPNTHFFLALLYVADSSIEAAKRSIRKAIGQHADGDYDIIKVKPVWKVLADWASILILDCDSAKTNDRAAEYLKKVAVEAKNERIKNVVLGHVSFLLNALNKDTQYITESEQIIKNA
ncbi:MAG: hypothetical protein LBQ98_07105 [Nitrososphaerota archaeon]|nr:hypothetical protein [Nitrososphaerota archaeon]